MVEIAKAVSYDSDVLIMDEPTSALTETEVAHLFAIIRDLRAQGKGIVYITHKMNELFEIADEVSVFRDGKYIGTACIATDVTRDDIIRMMVGREITQMFPKETVPIGDVVLSVREPDASTASSTTSPSTSAPGEILASPASSAPGAPTSPRRIFGVTPATSGDDRDPRASRSTISSPRIAMRHGMAFLTEDRKETGCFLILDVLENMQMAVLSQRFVKARLRAPGRGRAGECEEMQHGAARQDARPARAHREPVRRQPAEGADRPLAADQAEDPDPRRADARHRCRRQGGDPPADLAARRRRASR